MNREKGRKITEMEVEKYNLDKTAKKKNVKRCKQITWKNKKDWEIGENKKKIQNFAGGRIKQDWLY